MFKSTYIPKLLWLYSNMICIDLVLPICKEYWACIELESQGGIVHLGVQAFFYKTVGICHVYYNF